jgi:eukaryotic-like serine/threonine-protein kinase
MARVPLPSAGSLAGDVMQLAGFDVLAELGRGARSTVYRVRRASTVVPSARREAGDAGDIPIADYALKILDFSLADSAEALIAFRREAALLAGVNHPGLTQIHEVGTVSGRPYLVMDLVTGQSLAEVLTAGPMSAEQVIALALDIVDPLAAVHRRGLLHRDLKPPNIMVLADGQGRLIDFGLTAREGEGDALAAVGTFAYCAPEQSGVLRRPVDNRSDLYSLGVVLFECLAGALPFPTADVGELLRMHAVTPPPDLGVLVPGIPRGLAEAVATLLAKDPDDRYQNGEDLAADLRALAGFGPLIRRATQSPVGPLSGRDVEVARLAAAWRRASGGRGGACVIRGASGAGKSSLAADLASTAEVAGSVVLRGKCSPDGPVPFGPLRAAVEDHLRDLERRSTEEREIGYARIRGACAGGAAAILKGLTPALSAALGDPSEGPGGSDSVAGIEDQDQFALAVAGFLTGLARECGGLIVLVDDVQWLDPGSRRVLALLSFELDTTPALVVMTARDDAASAVPTNALVAQLGAAIAVDLVLAPLDESGVAGQIGTMMPGLNANTRVVTLLNARSNGSPFVVQEYLRAIVDAGLLQPFWGTWILDEEGLDALALPNDALGLVIARVAGLGPHVRDLLIVAAAIGARFRPEVVAAVRSDSLEVVLAGLVEAAGHGLVEPRDGGRFAFLHDRIREALLDELDPAQITALHGQIAEALEAMPVPRGGHGAEHVYAVAYHHMQGDHRQPGRAGVRTATAGRALAAGRAAGQLALENHAPAEAVTFLEYAAEAGNPRDSGFLLLLGTALYQADRPLEARGYLEQALDAEPDPLTRAEILILIVGAYRSTWELVSAREAVARGLAELGVRLPRNPLVLAVSTLGVLVAALLMHGTGIGFGRATGVRRRRCQVIAELHSTGAHVNGLSRNTGQMIAHSLRNLYRANQLGAGREYALSQGTFGIICAFAGLHGAGRRALARAQSDPASSSSPYVRATVANLRAVGLYLGGQDNGQALSEVIENHFQWLDLGVFLDTLAVLNSEACVQGRTEEGKRWLALGQRRLEGRNVAITAFTCTVALTDATLGRGAQAGTELRRINAILADNSTLALTLSRLSATLVVLSEQGEFGALFDDAVAEFEALRIVPARAIRFDWIIYFRIAQGRLAQLRAADEVQRPARLLAARQAVRIVLKGPKIDVLQARGVLVQADLLVLENKSRQAMKVLERLPAFLSPDAPRVSFEAARIRGRALIALGGVAEARRQAEAASAIAQAQAWPHLVRSIGLEFALASPERQSTSVPTASATSQNTEVERQRLKAVQQVSSAASRVLNPGVLARIALDETVRILRADRAFLFLIDGPNEDLVPHLGRDAEGHDVPELTGYSASLVRRVRETRAPLVVTGTDEGAALGAQSVVLHGLRSIMVAPLELEGRLLGVVYLDSQVAKGIFTIDDVGILTALTTHIATSLETTRAAQLEISVQTARQQRDLADTLRQSLQSMSETIDPLEVTKRLLEAATRVVHCDGAWLLSGADPEEAGCVLITNDGEEGALVRHPISDEPRLRALIAQDQPSIQAPGNVPSALTERLAGVTSWITLPLLTHHGKIGVLVLTSTSSDVDLSKAIEVAAALAAQGVAAYDKAVLFTQVQDLAVVDELTGIANRRRFFEVAARDLAAAVRHDRPLTALMIDIDHFKVVNDTHGHATGDDVIRAVAQRLSAQIRQSDLVGRYGGEEFALLLHGVDPQDDDLPERLRACIADLPVETKSGPLDIHVSIGLAHLTTADGSVAALLSRADEALYQAKQAGRNCVRSTP